jgi:hypothetical protein
MTCSGVNAGESCLNHVPQRRVGPLKKVMDSPVLKAMVRAHATAASAAVEARTVVKAAMSRFAMRAT